MFGTILNGCSKNDVSIPQEAAGSYVYECIKCNDYEVGDTFFYGAEILSFNPRTVSSSKRYSDTFFWGGQQYVVANRKMLDNAVDDVISGHAHLGLYCTSKVTNMDGLFLGHGSFNQDIYSWDMSNVRRTRGMFADCKSFNKYIGNWDVSNVTNMDAMFSGASAFNQDLTKWCVSDTDSEPINFSHESGLTPANHPVWGTCPE